jgi:hypothetical protein
VRHDPRRRNAAQAGHAATPSGGADRPKSSCLTITLNGRTMAVLTIPGRSGESAVGRALVSIGSFLDESACLGGLQ